MAAGLHLRTVLGLLLSLATDPHPTVHFWALEALEKTITSAGLSFSSHVPSCLGIISQLILSDLFDPEDVITTISNVATEFPTLASLVRCVDAIINILGPDLSSSKKSRNLICMLVQEMEHEPDPMVAAEAVRCTQHLTLFAPDTVDLHRYIRQLESNLTSNYPEIQQISCEAIYGLIRKDITSLFSNATPGFSNQLWALLNGRGLLSMDIEDIIRSWVEQTALTDVQSWVEICLRFLTHSGPQDLNSRADAAAGTDASDFVDEAAAFSSQPQGGSIEERSNSYLRWQAVSFALGCLRRVVELNLKNSIPIEDAAHPLVVRVGDLIKVAFTACTSTVIEIRLGGLKLLHDLIKATLSQSLLLTSRGLPPVWILIFQKARCLSNTKPRLPRP